MTRALTHPGLAISIKMNTDTDKIQRFCSVFEIPGFMKPWVDRFFEKPEIDLVLMLADRPMKLEEIADRSGETDKTARMANARSFLERAYKQGKPRNPSQIYAEYILLHESEALLDRVNHVFLLPCNCRSMLQRCDQTVYTCLRFDNYRNLG